MTELPDSLRILARLRSLTEADFAELIRRRRVSVRGIGDLHDLAEQLERPERVAEAVERLPWLVLRGLRLGEPEALAIAEALTLAVPGADGPELLPGARERVHEALAEVPSYVGTTGTTPDTAGTEAARSAGVLATDAIALLDVAPRSVRHARDGVRMSGVDVRRLAVELERPASFAGSVYRWLFAANAIAPDLDDVWRPTPLGRDLVNVPVEARWRMFVAAWLDELTLANLRTLAEATGAAVPLGAACEGIAPEEPETATSAITLPGDHAARYADATALGLIDQGLMTPLGALVLDGQLNEAEDLLRSHLPEETGQVYLQPDQTIIAPGPLRATVDAQLREVATLERRALASEYRISSSSISRALGSGMSADEVREFLAQVSLTGVPQPIEYLIANAAERFGLVRVRALGRAGSRIRTEVPELRDAMRVDAGLAVLGLRPAGLHELDSRVGPETALATLLDAYYPAVAESESGEILTQGAKITAPVYVPEAAATATKLAATLAAEAAASTPGDDARIWLQRQLELARRDRRSVAIEVEVPGGEPTVLRVVPIAVSEARVRARDADAEVERTVPMPSIIRIVDEPAS